MAIAQVQRFTEQLSDPTGKSLGTGPGRLQQLGTPTEQMLQTLLMASVLELVVGGPTIVNQETTVVQPEKAFGHGATAGGIDLIGGGIDSDHAMQPSAPAADTPAGLVGHGPRRLPDGGTNHLVYRFAALGGPQDSMHRATGGEADTEQVLQA